MGVIFLMIMKLKSKNIYDRYFVNNVMKKKIILETTSSAYNNAFVIFLDFGNLIFALTKINFVLEYHWYFFDILEFSLNFIVCLLIIYFRHHRFFNGSLTSSLMKWSNFS